jgi:hypothetical protein
MGWTAAAGARAWRAAHPVSRDANARQSLGARRARIGFSNIDVPSLNPSCSLRTYFIASNGLFAL